jgi:hypothetical protein
VICYLLCLPLNIFILQTEIVNGVTAKPKDTEIVILIFSLILICISGFNLVIWLIFNSTTLYKIEIEKFKLKHKSEDVTKLSTILRIAVFDAFLF